MRDKLNLDPICRLQAKCDSHQDRRKLAELRDLITCEAKAVSRYESQLKGVGDFGAAAPKPAPPPPTPVEQNYVVPRAPRPQPDPPKEDPAKWDPPSRPPPARAPAPQGRRPAERPAPRASHVPPSNWQPKPPVPKVDSGRAGPAARKRDAAKEKEPWEAWEGQDKELAGNLAQDIMEASPGIRWTDIAGLHDAKRILQARCPHITAKVIVTLAHCRRVQALDHAGQAQRTRWLVQAIVSAVLMCRKRWCCRCCGQSCSQASGSP